jgi:hypothetical protein
MVRKEVEGPAPEPELHSASAHRLPQDQCQYATTFCFRSTQKYFGVNIQPRKPRFQMEMSKTTNLRRPEKIFLVGTVGTTHKTNFRAISSAMFAT